MSTKAEKLSQASKYRHFALVTLINARFPIDNLRYDRAIPWKETDANAIEQSHFRFALNYRGQVIIFQDSPDAKPHWQTDRWNQTGVRINPISAEEAYDLDRNRDDQLPRLKLEQSLQQDHEDLTPAEVVQRIMELMTPGSLGGEAQRYVAVELTASARGHENGKVWQPETEYHVTFSYHYKGGNFGRTYHVRNDQHTEFQTLRDCLADIVEEFGIAKAQGFKDYYIESRDGSVAILKERRKAKAIC